MKWRVNLADVEKSCLRVIVLAEKVKSDLLGIN